MPSIPVLSSLGRCFRSVGLFVGVCVVSSDCLCLCIEEMCVCVCVCMCVCVCVREREREKGRNGGVCMCGNVKLLVQVEMQECICMGEHV